MIELLASRDFQIGVLVGVVALLAVRSASFAVTVLFRPLAMAAASGVRVGIGELVGMRLRGTPAELVITALIMDRKRGGELSLATIEAGYLAFGEEAGTPGRLLEILSREGVGGELRDPLPEP